MKLHPGLHLQLEGEDPGAGVAVMLGRTHDGTDQRREVEPRRLVHLGRASRPASPLLDPEGRPAHDWPDTREAETIAQDLVRAIRLGP